MSAQSQSIFERKQIWEKEGRGACGKELVRMTGIMKEFPGVKALDNVKLDLYAGEVLALLGKTVQVSQH